ncbi:MAG: DUF4255 domain-containing protein [Dehalococcoidia bacterium]|nr:DUF4255 domain-containing protein [Dehalococcoidia bacterium]
MISDLDETIRQLLLKTGKLDPAEVDISFDMPDRQWSASISKPTVNVYLYDIHENRELRDNEWTVSHDKGMATRKKTPMRVDLSYLVTVWTNDMLDQHRLLSHLLAVLFRHKQFPEEALAGSLKDMDWPIRTQTAQPDGVLRNTSDFWSALDNQLKPSINYVVTLPIDLGMMETAPEVRTKVFKFSDGESTEEDIQINGIVYRKGKRDQIVPDAVVAVKELQMTATTDKEGNYAFARLRPGSYTVEVSMPEGGKSQTRIKVPDSSYDIEL